MDEASGRATSLVKQLLSFARQQPIDPTPVDVVAHLTAMQGLLGSLAGCARPIQMIHSDTPAMVLIDPSQLEQIVMNLVVNARDAMPDGGQIALDISRVRADTTPVEALLDGTTDVVRIVVSDDGPGIPVEFVKRVFEHFFTTKPEHQGTGLGLATVLGAAQQAGGTVRIDPTRSAGTAVEVYLPALADD